MFENRVVWITGASSGIGRALTIALSQVDDAQIFISARSVDNLNKTIQLCNNDNVIAYPGDLTNQQSNQQIVSKIVQASGSLDIAILNAGTCEYVDIEKFDSQLFKRQIDTNFMSMVYAIEALLPHLKNSTHPQLIGMSSTAAYLGLPRAEAYGATKAAIRNLFSSLQVTLRKLNIASAVICPGFVETELTARNDFSMPAIISAEKAAQQILKGIAKYEQEIHFPKKFSLSLKLIASLPSPIRSWLIEKTMERT